MSKLINSNLPMEQKNGIDVQKYKLLGLYNGWSNLVKYSDDLDMYNLKRQTHYRRSYINENHPQMF